MQSRIFGRTGEEVSLLGVGGFHLLDITQRSVDLILNRYLDAGGNYIETSASYGDGESERRISRAVGGRRDEYLLATKVDERDRNGALKTLERSLINLQTDHIDVWFMHAVQEQEEAEAILAPGGALEAAEEARKTGKARFIGISGHGQPEGILSALRDYDFDCLMVPTNYYDRFNFPDIEGRLFPFAAEKGTTIIGMKALGDGYLWRSAGRAFRYAWSLPVSHVVAGINDPQMLEQDMAYAQIFTPMSEEEMWELFAAAPEYRNYVCRQCEVCPAEDGLPLRRIFELEGWYDRQMWDQVVLDPEDYCMRIRLGPWFGQGDLACETYSREGLGIDPNGDYSHLSWLCPFGLDIDAKLKLADAKLTRAWSLS
jgi:predicted aldo/keto reductase-like oxidoreductase